jgi:cysteinyl-tRNA synthetase
LQFLGFIDNSSFRIADKIEEIDKDFIISKINERLDAKKNKNYQLADKIRQELLDKGVILEDIANDKTNYSFK